MCAGVVLQESGFYLHALYNKNKPKSDELMTECGSEYFRVSTVSSVWSDQRSSKFWKVIKVKR